MPSPLDNRLAMWKSQTSAVAKKKTENQKTLTIKVPLGVAEHLAQVAKAMKVPRATLLREIFDHGYDELRKTDDMVRSKKASGKAAAVAPAPLAGQGGAEGDPVVSPGAMGVLVGVGVSSGQRRRRGWVSPRIVETSSMRRRYVTHTTQVRLGVQGRCCADRPGDAKAGR